MTDDRQRLEGSPDPEMVFRAVRHSVLADLERNFTQRSADRDAEQRIGSRIDKGIRTVLERSHLDLAAADDFRASETQSMHEHVAETRLRLADRDPHRAARLRDHTERALDYLQSGWSQPYLLGADVVAARREHLEDYRGEAGNPATWLYDANDARKIKASTTGGPGCTGGWSYCPAAAVWYFAWPAATLGPRTVQAWLSYHGSRILYALPTPFSYCEEAGAVVRAKLDVYQQVYYPGKYSKFLGQDEKEAFSDYGAGISTGVLDGGLVLTTDVTITTVSQVYIAVTFILETAARGPVAYAELNFQDGSTNEIDAPFVLISS
jgi:hypothetical protein